MSDIDRMIQELLSLKEKIEMYEHGINEIEDIVYYLKNADNVYSELEHVEEIIQRMRRKD